jgi:putative Mn2+ efflux pump MntP
MNAKQHNQTLGTLHFVYGAVHGLSLLGLLGLLLIFKFASVAGELVSTSIMIVGTMIFLILMLVVGILPLIVGIGFRKRRGWIKPLAIALAVVSLVNIPIGTALGVYTIKFFRSAAGVELYGGQASAADANELENAFGRAKPLMNVAERLK